MSVIRDYLELTRLHMPFMGNTLLFWPCAWGLTIAARTVTLPITTFMNALPVFAVGSLLIHSAGCVLNDICDVDFDRQVERTKNRPLPAGKVSVLGAWMLYCVLLLPVLYILSYGDTLSLLMGASWIFPLGALYPLMKRWTWWPQAWLGLAFNWGLPVAWTTVTGQFPPLPVWILFAGGVCWTIVYDTIYACQDREDDARVGVKSTALLFGQSVRPVLVGFATILLLCLIYAGYLLNLDAGYWSLSFGGTLVHMAWQLAWWDEANLKDHRSKFESNGLVGVIIWLGMLYDYLHSL